MRLWHDPKFPMSEDDASHKRRGSLGGEDFRLPNGTPLYAPTSGTLRARNGGTGGWTLSLVPDQFPDFKAIEVMHCSGLGGLALGGPSKHVREGELVGLSGGIKGAANSGNASGPHAHEHIDWSNGSRTGLTPYLTAPAFAGTTSTPGAPAPDRKKIMRLIRAADTGATALIGEFTVQRFTDPNAYTYQANLNLYGPAQDVATLDVFETMCNEADFRRAALVAALKA